MIASDARMRQDGTVIGVKSGGAARNRGIP